MGAGGKRVEYTSYDEANGRSYARYDTEVSGRRLSLAGVVDEQWAAVDLQQVEQVEQRREPD